MTTSIDYVVFILAAVFPSFLISVLATAWMRRVAPKIGLIDQPAARKVHRAPTPLGGGVGIWLGVIGMFLIGQGALSVMGSELWLPELLRPYREGLVEQWPQLWILLGAGTILMLLGLGDDRWGLPWQLRLAVQFGVAVICVISQEWYATVFIGFRPLTIFVSVMWIAALINSFNMLDNMDALSGGVAAIAAAMFAAVMLTSGGKAEAEPQVFIAGLLLVFVGALLGFLWHNRPPARIFMGDAGSYFVGFCLAAATLLATFARHDAQRHTILAPLCVLAVPLYDMSTVLWIRFREGRSPFEADKSHFSHRLVELGMSRGQAVLTIYLTTATCGVGALLLYRVDDALGAAMIVAMVLMMLALVAVLESASRRRAKQNES